MPLIAISVEKCSATFVTKQSQGLNTSTRRLTTATLSQTCMQTFEVGGVGQSWTEQDHMMTPFKKTLRALMDT